MTFSTKKVSLYGKDCEPKQGVSNAYDSVMQGGIDGNCLCGIFGLRHSGKTWVCSKIINQAQKTNVYDRIYLITPTFLSNQSYFGKHIDEENVFGPNRDSIKQVIEYAEQDRDGFERYLQELKDYNEYMTKMKSKKDLFTDEDIFKYDQLGWLETTPDRPTWKYKKVRAPQSLVILDDILGSQVGIYPYPGLHRPGLSSPSAVPTHRRAPLMFREVVPLSSAAAPRTPRAPRQQPARDLTVREPGADRQPRTARALLAPRQPGGHGPLDLGLEPAPHRTCHARRPSRHVARPHCRVRRSRSRPINRRCRSRVPRARRQLLPRVGRANLAPAIHPSGSRRVAPALARSSRPGPS